MAGDKRALWLGLLLAAPLVGGCLGQEDPASEDIEEQSDQPSAKESLAAEPMTAEETTDESEGLDPTMFPPFYAQRVTTVEGGLGLSRLPVDLATVNGNVEVKTGAEGIWRLVATLTGYGATPFEAQERLAGLTFTWAHEDAGRHFITAHIEDENNANAEPLQLGSTARGHLALELPASVVVSLFAGTTNGDVGVDGIHADTARLQTTNGDVGMHGGSASILEAETTNGDVDVDLAGTTTIRLQSTNGDINAGLSPARSGTIDAQSTNGDLHILVQESERHGYEAVASTTNGKAEIALRDGTTRSDEGPGSSQASFETKGLGSRDVRVTVTVASTNGDAFLGPV